MSANSEPRTERTEFTSVLLCGGAGSRMGGVDKPLQLFRGRPLVEHLFARLPDGPVIVSANRNLSIYAGYGHPVVVDKHPDLGPLGGLASVAEHCQSTWLYLVPGDAPYLPEQLAPELREACRVRGTSAAYATTDRAHPLPLLVRKQALDDLATYLDAGERSVMGWLTRLGAATLDCADRAAQFANLNTLNDLQDP